MELFDKASLRSWYLMLSGPCVADPCLLYSVQFPGYLGLFLGNLTSVLQVSQEEVLYPVLGP